MPRLVLPLLAAAVWLAGCDQLGIESPAAENARREAEGKAIGGACRHAARALEDCYQMNRKADKAAVFAGWREMNDYMRENKIEPVTPQGVPSLAKAGESDEEASGDEHGPAPKAGKAADKHKKG